MLTNPTKKQDINSGANESHQKQGINSGANESHQNRVFTRVLPEGVAVPYNERFNLESIWFSLFVFIVYFNESEYKCMISDDRYKYGGKGFNIM